MPSRAAAGQWEAAGTWCKVAHQPQKAPTNETAKERITILHAMEAYLAKCQGRSIQPSTLAKYQTLNNQVRAYAEGRGYLYLDEFTVTDMDLFYASWKDGIRAKAKKLERLKSFVGFCIKRKWLAEDITSDLEAPEGSTVTVPKAPFTDDELTRLYTACAVHRLSKLGRPTKAALSGLA